MQKTKNEIIVDLKAIGSLVLNTLKRGGKEEIFIEFEEKLNNTLEFLEKD